MSGGSGGGLFQSSRKTDTRDCFASLHFLRESAFALPSSALSLEFTASPSVEIAAEVVIADASFWSLILGSLLLTKALASEFTFVSIPTAAVFAQAGSP